jgi:Cytochrome P460
VIRAIVANPVMIKAYQAGVPGNGKPFPDGSKIVKLEWKPKKVTDPPFSASAPDTVPGDLAHVEFIIKDSKRFSDSHGWGYAMFDYDAASGTFSPANLSSKPPVGHDAKCGAACHIVAGASKDYIFTAYPER